MRFEVGPEDRGRRLDIFLTRFFENLTRSGIQAMNRRGEIRVNGECQKAGYRIQVGDTIEVEPQPAQSADGGVLEPEPIPLEVLYEDHVLAVVEKPAGMVVHPGAGNRTGTLANALRARFPLLSDAGGGSRPGIVHRLDKWTSGLMLVAKNNEAHRRLSRSFQTRQVRKVYVAALHGRLRNETGSVDFSIGRHPTVRTRMAVQPAQGRSAHSEYQVLERKWSFSLVRVVICTGRTHQIRVHMSAIGHPVLGDTTYGAKAHASFVRQHGPLDRYFLHASELEFPHPTTSARMVFSSVLPARLMELWHRLPSAG